MTQIVPTKDRIQTIRGLLGKSLPQIQMALPKHMSADRMLRVAMTSIQQTPKLLECSPQSLVGAVIESSQLGLEPDNLTGEAYLVPYGSKCKLIPGYKGLLTLARRSGTVKTIYAHLVRERDDFHYELGLHPDLRHIPHKGDDAGDVTHAYAVAILNPDGVHFEVMTRSQVETIRKRSKAANAGPWVTDWDEMARKTPIRRLCKYLTLSPEMNRAIAIEDSPDVVEVLEGVPVDVADSPISTLDALADAIDEEVEAEDPETDPNGRKAQASEPTPKPKATRRSRLSKSKAKKYADRIKNNSVMLPSDVQLTIKDRLGEPLANLWTEQEDDLISLLDELGV